MSTYSKELKEEAMRLSDEIGLKKAAAQVSLDSLLMSEKEERQAKDK